MALTDAELVNLSLKNKNSYRLIVRRYENKLLRYIRRLTNSTIEDTEDILQEVFVKAYLNLYGFNQNMSFSSWIYRICHNEVISFWRKKKIRPEHLPIFENDLKFADTTPLSKELDVKFNRKKIFDILNQLPFNYREILILRFFEERDYNEISDILQIPLNTVGTWLVRAKKLFKKSAQKKKVKF